MARTLGDRIVTDFVVNIVASRTLCMIHGDLRLKTARMAPLFRRSDSKNKSGNTKLCDEVVCMAFFSKLIDTIGLLIEFSKSGSVDVPLCIRKVHMM